LGCWGDDGLHPVTQAELAEDPRDVGGFVLPVMGHSVQTGLPAAVLDVYHAPELVLLALGGLVIAVVGALAPASWAARTRTAAALRTE
jgi:putative ABC transport system permease protein